jgi:hypothetical protein
MVEPQRPLDSKPPGRVSRRRFLTGALTAAAGGFLAACQAAQQRITGQTPWPSATPYQVLESPIPAGDVTATPPIEGELALEQFLDLSALLTGVENLNPTLGATYLRALQGNPQFQGQLAGLYDIAGFGGAAPPVDLSGLEAAGVFDQEASRSLADAIIEMWYTGTITQGEETIVVTYVDALAWKVLTFTKPRTVCGTFGFWETRPAGNY